MKSSLPSRAFTLVEAMIATAITGMVGLMLFSIFYTGTILGAKNIAINTGHQQVRMAMIDMLQNIHTAISAPVLTDSTGTAYPSPTPTGAGVSFQQWSSGPHRIIPPDPSSGTNQITIIVTGATLPAVGQHVVIPSHQIEADISAVAGNAGNYTMTLANIYGPALTPPVTYPVSNLPISILGTGSNAGDVICFVTDRCSYTVSNNTLWWNKLGNSIAAGNGITNGTPFSLPSAQTVAVDLPAADSHYSNRGFNSTNVLLDGQISQKAKLTTYQ
jgi:Prokaryotic N-terminal methylation motif